MTAEAAAAVAAKVNEWCRLLIIAIYNTSSIDKATDVKMTSILDILQ